MLDISYRVIGVFVFPTTDRSERVDRQWESHVRRVALQLKSEGELVKYVDDATASEAELDAWEAAQSRLVIGYYHQIWIFGEQLSVEVLQLMNKIPAGTTPLNCAEEGSTLSWYLEHCHQLKRIGV